MLELIRGFKRSTTGNVAMIFTLAMVPVVIAIGAGIDFSRATYARSLVQAALDSAALATATAPRTLSDVERIAVGEQVFSENFDGKFDGITATPQIAVDGQYVTATASFTVENTLMNVGGILSTSVGGHTEVMTPSIGNAEVVFVLDYSSSMDDQYEPMRDATISLIDTITQNRTSPDVKIGLVPFAKFVYTTLPGEHVLGGTSGVPWTNCTVGRKWPWVWKDDVPTSDDGSKWGRTDGDDDIDHDEYEDCYDHSDNDLVIRPLTTDHEGTVAQLNAMTPDSGTNIALGMEFGFHLVSPSAPFSEGVAYDETDWRKFVILLSDGAHNKPGFGPGGSYNTAQGVENLARLCDAMKDRDVLVITVAYEMDDPDGKEQLENCASASQYYLEGDEENIATVFNGIGHLLNEAAFISR